MASNRKKRWKPKYWSKFGVPKAAPEDLMESWLMFPENKRKAEFERRKEKWREEEFAKRKEAWRKEEFQKRVEEIKDEKIIKEQKSVDKPANMSYNDLKQEAKTKGIKNYWNKKKEQLVEELNSLNKKAPR